MEPKFSDRQSTLVHWRRRCAAPLGFLPPVLDSGAAIGCGWLLARDHGRASRCVARVPPPLGQVHLALANVAGELATNLFVDACLSVCEEKTLTALTGGNGRPRGSSTRRPNEGAPIAIRSLVLALFALDDVS